MTEYKMDLNRGLSFNGDLDTYLTTVEQLLDTLPLSSQIRDWLRLHSEVRDALKVIYQDRFVPVYGIAIVDNPKLEGVKQSVGIFTIDKNRDHLIIQDFLMHQDDDSFVYFTGPNKKIAESSYVKWVNNLPTLYGPDGKVYLEDNHHPKLETLDPKLQVIIKKLLESVRQN
jgi:hypothetical protein